MSRDRYTDAELVCQSIEAAADVLSDLVPAREEARLRLTCAALTGYVTAHADLDDDKLSRWAVGTADACLALLYPALPPGPEVKP